jgi:hypothetical protein
MNRRITALPEEEVATGLTSEAAKELRRALTNRFFRPFYIKRDGATDLWRVLIDEDLTPQERGNFAAFISERNGTLAEKASSLTCNLKGSTVTPEARDYLNQTEPEEIIRLAESAVVMVKDDVALKDRITHYPYVINMQHRGALACSTKMLELTRSMGKTERTLRAMTRQEFEGRKSNEQEREDYCATLLLGDETYQQQLDLYHQLDTARQEFNFTADQLRREFYIARIDYESEQLGRRS